MSLPDDDTIAFGDDLDGPNAKPGALTHPYVTFFHLAFRSAAIVLYLMCRWFIDSFITSFVVVVLLLSMDFWTVKNITGRLMVGLRWWNYVDDDGQSRWVFESKKTKVNERESRIFWTSLILTQLIWFLFFVTALFGFNLKWLLLVVIAIMLNGSNLYGYIKCKIGSSKSISSATQDFFKTQVLQSAVSMVANQASQPAPSQPANTV